MIYRAGNVLITVSDRQLTIYSLMKSLIDHKQNKSMCGLCPKDKAKRYERKYFDANI